MSEDNKSAEGAVPAPAAAPPATEATAAKPADESDNKHDKQGKKKPSGKSHTGLIILLVIVILLVVGGFLANNYLNEQALRDQEKYQEICVLLKGEVALFIDGDFRSLHCVSSMFDTKDKNRACTQQSECQGACIGDTSDPIFDPPDPTTGDAALVPPVRCSGGIRLLPEFIPPPQEEPAETEPAPEPPIEE